MLRGLMNFTDALYQPEVLVAVLVAIAAFAAVVSAAMPYMTADRLGSRMRYVAKERDRLRAQERARLAAEGPGSLRRNAAKPYMQRVVDQLNLRKLLESDDTRTKLKMAGLRSQAHLITFLFFRVVLPPVLFLVVAIYMFFIGGYEEQPTMVKFLVALGAAYLGFFAPNIYISNKVKRRQQEIQRAFPDALDLMLICVESGMSIEQAFRRVSNEIGSQSIALAEELSLTTAELSYLQDRRAAYENLGKRTGLEGVKAVVTALTQAERYGTPLGNAMRVMAQENRDIRMSEAEKRAAALPPKLTVPMIVFFLPVLFIVILGPAAIKLMRL
ncbi:type II secretion system F family protein [Lutibaculum baratangense]|uniref:Type II/IV secretion system protein TadC, associated with Flp pilus assembly n=1 Tax=Lutibaculum baratangense AMV1 TaxID=631454 RepID=V4TF64_9HYPH|nr:type II secretion system F family protein [Lutibaculum baratangense]ESR24818.1 Type II/IV secretion system protein TadC, associated with Flp pilus assembly [Lutibaculum baratangense AMV1]